MRIRISELKKDDENNETNTCIIFSVQFSVDSI